MDDVTVRMFLISAFRYKQIAIAAYTTAPRHGGVKISTDLQPQRTRFGWYFKPVFDICT